VFHSAFTIADVRYLGDEVLIDEWGWRKPPQSMQMPLATVLSPGLVCAYEYDFGSMTELTLKVMAQREVIGQTNAIEVLARNTLPVASCDECNSPAMHVCEPYLDKGKGYLCADCAQEHEHTGCKKLWQSTVNSPRAGVCGYPY
jgi:hypothetical protein